VAGASDHCSKKTEVQVSFDLTKRIDLRAANKSIGFNFAGGFDSFRERCGLNIFMMRVMEFFYEKAIRYGAKFQENENSSQVSLFRK
jgi:DNA polymerase-3 subunit alpha